jgi:hypothetical protein
VTIAMKSIAVVVIVIALGRTAAAQPGLTPSRATMPVEGEVSENTALAMSLGGTALSWGLIAAGASMDSEEGGELLGKLGGFGAVVAPSFGHWYRGKYWTRGLGIRLAGTGVAAFGGILILSSIFGGGEGNAEVGVGMMIAGGGLFVGGTVDDIIQAPRMARRHNMQLRGLAVVPTVQRGGGGLALSGSF